MERRTIEDSKVTIVSGNVGDDSWEGIYVDGKLKAEDHELNSGHILGDALGIKYDYIEVDQAWFDRHRQDDYLPEELSDVKEAKK